MRKAAIYCRVSTEEQKAENTSLATQLEACVRFAKSRGLDVDEGYSVTETYSGLTIDRPRLQVVLGWIRTECINDLVIYSTDRFSRDGYDLLTLIKECELHKVSLHCVSEDLGQGPLGQLINFVRGWASGLEAAKIKERTMRGKLQHARNGEIPSGYGRYHGYLGLRYDSEKKRFLHVPGQIEVAREILHAALAGDSSSRITQRLQAKGVQGVGGNLIHRSSVNRVMKGAGVYAGTVIWNGIPIEDKVDPIITAEEAAIIAERMRRNKQRSYGFGKRKWLSGRVFCQLCGRRYVLDLRKGCHCNGDDKRNPIVCRAPRMSFRVLSNLASQALWYAMMHPDSVVAIAKQSHDMWEKERRALDSLQQERLRRHDMREKKRRLLSHQHVEGGLTDEEYDDRLRLIKKEEAQDREPDISDFLGREPPTPEQVERTYAWLSQFKPFGRPSYSLLDAPPDSQSWLLDNLAETLGLRVIIGPAGGKDGDFSAQVHMNLPVPQEELSLPSSKHAIVSQSSACCALRRRPPPAPVWRAPGP